MDTDLGLEPGENERLLEQLGKIEAKGKEDAMPIVTSWEKQGIAKGQAWLNQVGE